MRYPHLVSALAFGLIIGGQACATTEIKQRAAVAASTQRSFLADHFNRLERVSRKYRTTRSRTSSGLWNLTLFYAGIDDAIENQTKGLDPDTSFEALDERTRKWVQQFPDSPTAHIVQSMVLIQRAWAYRGAGYASTVKPESWAPFKQYIAMARVNLETSKSVASVDPRWYESMLIIARAENWDRDEFDALLNEALEKEPLFYQTYFMALQYLLPKWHGSIREIDDFARNAVERTRNQEGLAMYARIYWYASQAQFKNDIFNNSLVEWPPVKGGFEDVISRYPDAWNLNNYARFACLARDKPKTVELFKRIESSVVAEVWVPISLKQECANWAFRQ